MTSSPVKLFSLVSFLVVSCTFVGALSNDMYMPSMPILTEVFNTSDNWIQATLSAWFIGSILLQLIFGPLSDRYGRRPLLLGAGILLVLASLLCSFSVSFVVFFIGRVLQGVAFSGLLIAAMAIVNEMFKETHQSTQMMALLGICTSLSPILGPIIGGVVYITISWQANFYLVALIALVLLLGLWRRMPETNENLNPEALNPKQLTSTYVSILKNYAFLGPALSLGALLGAILAYITSVSFIVIEFLGISPQLLGFTLIPAMASYMVGATITGKLARRVASYKIILAGLVLSLLGGIMLIGVGFVSPTLTAFLVSIVVLEFGFGLAHPALSNTALSAVKQSKGSASALLSFCMMGGGTLGSLVMSMVYNDTMWSMALIAGGAAILAFLSYLPVLRWELAKQADSASDENNSTHNTP